MFEIEKSFTFEAGHVLKHHDGKCSQPHGHSYRLIVKLRAKDLTPSGPKKNMVIDFSDISRRVKIMIDQYFDHKWVNDTLGTDSPTCEFMTKWIFDHLEKDLPGLHEIILYETATSRASYRKD